MASVKALLVLGNQAKPVELKRNATIASLRQAFEQYYPNQTSQSKQVVLQIWDEKWAHWVDICSEDLLLEDGIKFRLIRKESIQAKLGNLNSEDCAFFCCDMQERFKPAIAHFEDITLVSSRLLEGAYTLEVPVFVTEQYPKGLLHTVPELDISKAKAVIEKTMFSMIVPEMIEKLQEHAKDLRSVILFGVEAHVCIQQTALDLLAMGLEVHVVADATSSRSEIDRALAFERLRALGVTITTAETVLLQLVKDKNHPNFKQIQGIIKTTPPQKGIRSSL